MEKKCILSNSEYARRILAKERCCGRDMSIDSLYLNGTERITAVCRKCGTYVCVETGQFDEEELQKMIS